jgi:hypothetical protein
MAVVNIGFLGVAGNETGRVVEQFQVAGRTASD